MNEKRQWGKRALGAVVIGVVVMTVSGVTALKAQAQAGFSGNPFNQVLGKLDEIAGSTTKKLDTIINSLAPLPSTVTLTTHLVVRNLDDEIGCGLLNVGTEPITGLKIAMADSSGVSFPLTDPLSGGAPLTVQPGHGVMRRGGPDNSVLYCRCVFTFHGTVAAVRADLQMFDEFGRTRLSIDAR
jgi:hypothetical protein